MDTLYTKFINLEGAVALGKTTRSGATTLIPTATGSKSRMSPKMYEEIGSPEEVEVLQQNGKILILPARSDAKIIHAVRKGRYIYDTDVARSIADLAGINLKAITKSISVGRYTIEYIDENTKVAVISFTEPNQGGNSVLSAHEEEGAYES